MEKALLSQIPKVLAYRTTVSEFAATPIADGLLQIAGPCAIESADVLLRVAKTLQSAGVHVLRGGAYKHRTLPYSFSGIGEIGLKVQHEIARTLGMLTVAEFMEGEQAPFFDQYVDIIQVGARNMRNTYLFKHVAGLKRPVILKRDMAATLFEWLAAAEHLLHLGVTQLVLCERGVRWHDPQFRNLLDLGAVAWIKEYLSIPVIVDPSHAAGRPDLIKRLALAAIACGADGLMIEVHPVPSNAKCDGQQALTPDRYIDLRSSLAASQRRE